MNRRTTNVLRVLAVSQAVSIAVLAAALLRGGDVAPAAATAPEPAAASPARAAEPSAGALPVGTPEAGALAAAVPVASAPTAAATATTGTVLYGRITNEAGEPLPEGWAWFRRGTDGAPVANVSLPQDTTYALSGLSPGRLDYQVRAAGHVETKGTVEIAAGVARQRHDIVVAPTWVLAVRILTDDDQPLRTALLEHAKARPMLHRVQVGAVATVAQPTRDFPPTGLREVDLGLGRWRGADGFDRMRPGQTAPPKDATGVLEIDARQPVWISAVMRHRVLASVAAEPGSTEVTLRVPLAKLFADLATVRGRAVDGTTGEAIAGANVAFGDQQSSGGGGKTDGDGRFEVRDLRPGLLTLELHSAARSPGATLVLVQPGQVLDLGDVALVQHVTIKGRCEGCTGKPGEGHITYTPLTSPAHPAMRHDPGHAQIGADGSFQLWLAPGKHVVRATGVGGAVVELDTAALGDAPLVLRLQPEAPLRIDVRSNGEPWELALFDAHNREVWRSDLGDGWRFALPLVPGCYRAELRDAQGKVQTRTIALGDDGADLRVP